MPWLSEWQLAASLRCALMLPLFAGLAACWLGVTARSADGPVVVAEIKGAIGVGTGYYVNDALAFARKERAQLLVLKNDTPGGLVAATREIIQAILASSTPVAVYVSPSGARAVSAGTYIAYASHIVAMAPGTHLGAATPIQMQFPGMPQAPKPAPAQRTRKVAVLRMPPKTR